VWHGRATEGNDGDEQDNGNHAAQGYAMTPEEKERARAIVDKFAEDLPGFAFMLIAVDTSDDPNFDESLTLVSNISRADGARLLRHLLPQMETGSRVEEVETTPGVREHRRTGGMMATDHDLDERTVRALAIVDRLAEAIGDCPER
jgi:hypothetical protein